MESVGAHAGGLGCRPRAVCGIAVEPVGRGDHGDFAVLKSGAAYVRSTRCVPDARVDFMLADAGPIAVLTSAGLMDRLNGCEVTVVDVADPRIDSFAGTPLPAPMADDVAYVIYTSGTTGVPKGVAITHLNVTRLFEGLDVGVVMGPGRCGPGVRRWRPIIRCGRSGVRCCMVAGWWWCPRR